MEPEFDPELEALLHQELRKLPPLKAPATLAPRVLAAIQARAMTRPWWQQSWWQWPLAAQVALVVLGLAIVGLFTGGGFLVDSHVSAYSQEAAQRLTPLNTIWNSLTPVADAGLLLWNKYFQPLLLYGLALLAFLYLSCVGAGTAFVRIALKRH